MAHLIFKTRQDADLYLMWSTVCDAPIGVGNQVAIEDLSRKIGPRLTLELLARINETGTSSMSGTGGWDDDGLVLREFPLWDSPSRWLPRKNFHEFVKAIEADDAAAIEKATEAINPEVHPVITIVIGGEEASA